MIKISVNSQPLDLPADFSIQVDDSSPIFSDTGFQSIPATIPATPHNSRILRHPAAIHSNVDPSSPLPVVDVTAGTFRRRGLLNITDASPSAGITFSIGFDNSTAYAAWASRPLSSLSSLPTFSRHFDGTPSTVSSVIATLNTIYATGSSLDIADLAIFPIVVSAGSDSAAPFILNRPASPTTLATPTSITTTINNAETVVSVPLGYGITPFIRAHALLDFIFADLGISLSSNPLSLHPDLRHLVILNNAADSIVTGSIRYSDLLPDISVQQFLHSLWVRFGLTFHIDFDSRTASAAFLDDILKSPEPGTDLASFAAAPTILHFNTPQYIKLSAQTSIDSAAPATDRFEDFSRGLDLSLVRLGATIPEWSVNPDREPDQPLWDGDIRESLGDDYYDDPDQPFDPADDPIWPDPDPLPDPNDPNLPGDPDEDRDQSSDDPDMDDHREPDRAPARSSVQSAPSGIEPFLAREFVTGTWFRLDSFNSRVRHASSPFFHWDPRPDGLEPLDLSSPDECVPLALTSAYSVPEQSISSFSEITPQFLLGPRHFHSFIRSVDTEDSETDASTPLAFLFAFTVGSRTIGRFSPEGDHGRRITLDDGSRPSLSLLFQFRDGLFARFWARYDEILRHAPVVAETSLNIPISSLLQIHPLHPVRFDNIRCLPQSVSYSLPAHPQSVPTTAHLRPIQCRGSYNIAAEQAVPDFSSTRHLAWQLHHSTLDLQTLDTPTLRAQVLDLAVDYLHYQPHGTPEADYFFLDPILSPVAIALSTEGQLTWAADSSIPDPVVGAQKLTRTYTAVITYQIYEIHQTGPDSSSPEPAPIHFLSVPVPYSVFLIARWFPD